MIPHLLVTIPKNAATMLNGLGLILPRGAHLNLLTLILKSSTFRARKQASLGGINDLPRSIMNIPWQQITHIKINGCRVLTRDCLLLLACCRVAIEVHLQALELGRFDNAPSSIVFPYLHYSKVVFLYAILLHVWHKFQKLEIRRIREEYGVSFWIMNLGYQVGLVNERCMKPYGVPEYLQFGMVLCS